MKILMSIELILVSSFRQVPSFGGDTIRRFVNNVSELKKMAARDFENLLQVSQSTCFKSWLATDLVMDSVPFLCLMGSYLSLTIRAFLSFYSYAHIGMAWRSFGCTLMSR